MAAVGGFLLAGAVRAKPSKGALGAVRAGPYELKPITWEIETLFNLDVRKSEAMSEASGGGGATEIVRVMGAVGPDPAHAAGGGVRGGDLLKEMATDAFGQFDVFKASLEGTQAMVEPLKAKLRATLKVRSRLEAGTPKKTQTEEQAEKTIKAVVCKRRTRPPSARFTAGQKLDDWATVARLAEYLARRGGGFEAILCIVLHARWRLATLGDSAENALRTKFVAAQSLGFQAAEARLVGRLFKLDGGLEDTLHVVLDGEQRLARGNNKEEDIPRVDSNTMHRFGAQIAVAQLKKRLTRRDGNVKDALRMEMGSESRIAVMEIDTTARQVAAKAAARLTAPRTQLRRKHTSSLRAAFGAMKRFSTETAVSRLKGRIVKRGHVIEDARRVFLEFESRLAGRDVDVQGALRLAFDGKTRLQEVTMETTARQAATTAIARALALKALVRRKHATSLRAAFNAVRKFSAETAVVRLQERLIRRETVILDAQRAAHNIESAFSRRGDDFEIALLRAPHAESKAEDLSTKMTAKQATAATTMRSMVLKVLLRRKHSNSLRAAFGAMRKVFAGVLES